MWIPEQWKWMWLNVDVYIIKREPVCPEDITNPKIHTVNRASKSKSW